MDFGSILDDFNGFEIVFFSARWNTAIGGPEKKRNPVTAGSQRPLGGEAELTQQSLGRAVAGAAVLLPAIAGTQRPLECHHRQNQRPLRSGDGWGARFQLLTGRWDTALVGFSKSIEISCPEVGFHPL
ncbi:hypothetical protein C2S51_024652 [Perilla frutescens var. frutescens]|nr:hypothetical protein C2S51_024652 [Perilla frutescens var. frutescens]